MAGFCIVTVVRGDEGRFVEVSDLLMITLPTTSYMEQNNRKQFTSSNLLRHTYKVLKVFTIQNMQCRVPEDQALQVLISLILCV